VGRLRKTAQVYPMEVDHLVGCAYPGSHDVLGRRPTFCNQTRDDTQEDHEVHRITTCWNAHLDKRLSQNPKEWRWNNSK